MSDPKEEFYEPVVEVRATGGDFDGGKWVNLKRLDKSELRKGTKLCTYTISNEMLETTDIWQYFSNGEWYVGSNLNNHKQNTIDDGYLVRDLCVSPTTKKETDMHEDLEFPSEKVNTSMLYLGQGHVEPESYTSNAEEEEAWQAAEERMDIIGHNGGTGDHYEAPASKYHVQIKGQWIDVYDILAAYNVTNPEDAHAIKKMLCHGQRGVKGGIQDMQEAVVSLQRAIELEQRRLIRPFT
jgi:hypothetical protein